MNDRKAPKAQNTLDLASEAWNNIPWRKLEKHCFRIQKRIFRASQQGNHRAVQKLQKLLLKSKAAQTLAVRRVTQDNQGKKTAGIDGIKSLQPAERLRLVEQIAPKNWPKKSPPVRRIYIPKPGKNERRPLGIPTLAERARQMLTKLALEPEWEAKFERNSYGFRPGRSTHDAIEAIFCNISKKDKYVLDADIKRCFDNIRHEELVKKLSTYPQLKQAIKSWLQAGAIDNEVFTETPSGTPQGGVISPLLANMALHGVETAIKQAFRPKEEIPQVIRYADDFVVLHPTLEGIKKAQEIATQWLQGVGLELKASKTKITHTLKAVEGQVGFNFLGFTIRQFPVGKRQWVFGDEQLKLNNHRDTAIKRHVKVKGAASPYDGNLLYWSQRLANHPMTKGQLAKLLRKQQGKCRWCELTFRDGDQIEIDHITPKSEGGGEELSNKFALHRHCHDERHSKLSKTSVNEK